MGIAPGTGGRSDASRCRAPPHLRSARPSTITRLHALHTSRQRAKRHPAPVSTSRRAQRSADLAQCVARRQYARAPARSGASWPCRDVATRAGMPHLTYSHKRGWARTSSVQRRGTRRPLGGRSTRRGGALSSWARGILPSSEPQRSAFASIDAHTCESVPPRERPPECGHTPRDRPCDRRISQWIIAADSAVQHGARTVLCARSQACWPRHTYVTHRGRGDSPPVDIDAEMPRGPFRIALRCCTFSTLLSRGGSVGRTTGAPVRRSAQLPRSRHDTSRSTLEGWPTGRPTDATRRASRAHTSRSGRCDRDSE